MNDATSAGFMERHPALVISGVVGFFLIVLMLLAELGLRLFGNVNIHYYTGYTQPGWHEYPYGRIPINSFGAPDEEFVMRPGERRIGYFGDSITYGVGAGYGYRMPDLLRKAYPDYRHWVVAEVGAVPTLKDISPNIKKFGLGAVTYIMNLNDILPGSEISKGEEPGNTTFITRAKSGFMGDIDQVLRGRSYLYTYIRLGIKNALQRAGYEAHGQVAYELQATKYRAVVEETSHRIVSLGKAVEAQGVNFCVLMIPYEMQVSADAARQYSSLGFSWEPGFLAGNTQQMVGKILNAEGINLFDARGAFSGVDLRVGDAFVYNKGDKVDWNHPNRRGHALIANWLIHDTEFKGRCLPNG